MKNLPPSRTADRIIVRLPEGMRDRLHERAAVNGRSMTAEVVHLLEQGLDNVGDLDALQSEAKLLREQLLHLDEASKHPERRLSMIEGEIARRLIKPEC